MTTPSTSAPGVFTKLEAQLAARGQQLIIWATSGIRSGAARVAENGSPHAAMVLAVDSTTIGAPLQLGLWRARQQLAGATSSISRQHDLPSNWLLAALAEYEPVAKTAYSGTSLVVQMVPPQVLLALKAVSIIRADIADAHRLMHHTGIGVQDVAGLAAHLRHSLGSHTVTAKPQPLDATPLNDELAHIYAAADSSLRPARWRRRWRIRVRLWWVQRLLSLRLGAWERQQRRGIARILRESGYSVTGWH